MNSIEALYAQLKERYGEPAGQWSLWCKRPKSLAEKELVIIESILTQRANWKNVQQAVANLSEKKITQLSPILEISTRQLAALIKPAGFYRQKAERLQRLARFFITDCGGVEKAAEIPTCQIRERLLSLKGVGPETADSILLYALEKPVFVIDEYTRRLVKRLKLSQDFSYSALQRLFAKSIRKDYALYQDFHALIVIDGKEKNRRPKAL